MRGISVCLLVGLCLGGTRASAPISAVDESYGFPSVAFSGQKITLLAIGQVSADEVICWTPDGKLNSDLAEKLKACLATKGDTPIPMRLNWKNRVVLLSVKDPRPGFWIRDDRRSELRYEKTTQNSDKTWNYVVYLPTDPKAEKADLTISANPANPDSVDLKFVKGSKATLNQVWFELAAIRRYTKDAVYSAHDPYRENYATIGNRLWYVTLANNRPMGVRNTYRIIAYDSKGNPIVKLGKDNSKSREDGFPYEALRSSFEFDLVPSTNNGIAGWFMTMDYENLMSFVTNVDPKRISTIKIVDYVPNEAAFVGVRLDPLPQK